MMGEVIRVSGRAPDVGDLLREAMVSQRFADVALCCSGGQRFLAHRLVLSAASPYLQDVLLAHGKAAGYSEPITVILAEVEGPELAAILGFVYTGSATVPRSRLEAFIRAAETLHVRIPPLTVSTFKHNHHIQRNRAPEDCYLDNVKIEETKIDSRYLRCEQYPSYDKWFNSTSWPFDSCLEGLQRGEWTLTSHDRLPQALDRSEDISRNIRFNRYNIADISDKKLPEVPITDSCPLNVNSISRSNNIENERYELHLRGDTVKRIIPSGEQRQDSFIGSDYSVSRMDGWELNPRDETSSMKLQHEAEKERDNNDFEGRLVTTESNSLMMALVQRPTTGSSSVTFEKQDYDPLGSTEAVGITSTNSPSATVTSNVTVNNPNNPRNNACGESCCRWRSPRRHVANRVPASPWSQLARPAHNSPKIRPVLLHNREDSDESVRPQWTDEVCAIPTKHTSSYPAPTSFVDSHLRETSPSGPLNLHHRTECASPYSFKIPETAEVPSGIEANVHYVDYVDNTRSLNFHDYQQTPARFSAATVLPVMEQFSPVKPVTEVPQTLDRCETTGGLYEDPTKSRLGPLIHECTNSPSLEEPQGVIVQHAISLESKHQIVNDSLTCNRRTLPRVELSHPISRLCDTVCLTGEIVEPEQCLIEAGSTVTAKEKTIKIDVEEARIITGKPIFSLVAGGIIQSDSNNNEATLDDSIHSRNSSCLPPPMTDSPEATANEGFGTCGSEDHRCDQCGKTFVTRASLKVHGRTHSGEKPFRCSDCGKEFSQLRNYKYHRSVHEGTREFAASCPECGKYFNDRGYLSSHMKIHRNRKEYACGECGKSFNQRVAYNMHVRIHTGVKPHQCDQCGKAFSRKMLLKQHLRTHSGERPYQCQICHKAFADRSNMTLHTRLHSGLKPYQCTLCSKAFTKKHHLKTHLNYHTGTKPYSCPNCSLRFSQSSNMRTHYKKCSAINNSSIGNISSQRSPRLDDSNDIKTASIVAEINDSEKSAPSSRTNALTPPNSDQESSILTPIAEQRSKSTRVYPSLRSKISSISDT